MERKRFAIPAKEQRYDISCIDPLRKSVRVHVDEVARCPKTDIRTDEEIAILRDTQEAESFYPETISEDVLLNRPIVRGGDKK